MSQLHNVFRFPEDTCLPARRRPVYSVIITLGLDGMAFASGLNRREEQALLTNSGDVAAWVYSWAHTLATRYRRLGFEPVLLGSGWHGSVEKPKPSPGNLSVMVLWSLPARRAGRCVRTFCASPAVMQSWCILPPFPWCARAASFSSCALLPLLG